MKDELKAKLYMLLDKYRWEGTTDDTDKVIAQIHQAYKEEQHTNALIWYTRLTNDLINDDDLKRTEHVGRILEYARIAAGLSEKDIRIVLPDEYIPHDPEFVAEHISPVVEVSDKPFMIMKAKDTFSKPHERLDSHD